MICPQPRIYVVHMVGPVRSDLLLEAGDVALPVGLQVGDRVQRGEYIADSGNTGFSSGPHLHFAVVRNVGMEIESLPILFAGQNTETIMPATGAVLTAH